MMHRSRSWMLLLLLSATATLAAQPPAARWSFDADAAGKLPPAFQTGLTGSGRPGRWVVRKEENAPSPPHVLAQLDSDDTDFRYPVAVASSPELRNVRLSVKCKMVSGQVDRAAGLVFRYANDRNYYITRANVLEGNIRLYYVKDGKRKQLATFDGDVTGEVWHDYRVEARGPAIRVFWNGKQVIAHEDSTFDEAGKVGVWTKADAVAYFDDLAVEPLER